MANNPFMPSVAQSLNAGSQDTLQQLLQRRMFEEESTRRFMALQQDGERNAFNISMKLKDQEQQDAALRFRREQADAKTKADAEKAASAKREATNLAGVRSMFSEGLSRGASRNDLLPLAVEAGGKIPVSLLPKEPAAPKPTLADIKAEAKARAEGTAEGRAPFKTPKATKVAKDNIKAPARFIQTLQGRVGSPGFENAESAIKSVQGRWHDWRTNYPGLDLNAVRTAVQNLYGQRVGSGGTDAIAAAVLEALKNDRDE